MWLEPLCQNPPPETPNPLPTPGNCFYIEDGVEEQNWFEHNIATFVHVSRSCRVRVLP